MGDKVYILKTRNKNKTGEGVGINFSRSTIFEDNNYCIMNDITVWYSALTWFGFTTPKSDWQSYKLMISQLSTLEII